MPLEICVDGSPHAWGGKQGPALSAGAKLALKATYPDHVLIQEGDWLFDQNPKNGRYVLHDDFKVIRFHVVGVGGDVLSASGEFGWHPKWLSGTLTARYYQAVLVLDANGEEVAEYPVRLGLAIYCVKS